MSIQKAAEAYSKYLHNNREIGWQLADLNQDHVKALSVNDHYGKPTGRIMVHIERLVEEKKS